MSRFSGKQYKGALRRLREIKREEAEKRNARYRAWVAAGKPLPR